MEEAEGRQSKPKFLQPKIPQIHAELQQRRRPPGHGQARGPCRQARGFMAALEDYSGLIRRPISTYFNIIRGENIIELNPIRNQPHQLTTLSIAQAMSFLVQGQITLIEFSRRVSHQTDSLFDVLNHPLQKDKGLLEEELEENNEAPPSRVVWIGSWC
ncbi:hypothetical protein LSTR_LSTR015535 [Laodelphax striatellus]|uniref:Uncharacterized protein n=1 Tax=Laodelphax striatellus TaxID=195883 RepID=A0A482X9E6_LAOST|nr:hypothetical protein LSTR_LSTR015535 [Laodelphax striatellus]